MEFSLKNMEFIFKYEIWELQKLEKSFKSQSWAPVSSETALMLHECVVAYIKSVYELIQFIAA